MKTLRNKTAVSWLSELVAREVSYSRDSEASTSKHLVTRCEAVNSDLLSASCVGLAPC